MCRTPHPNPLPQGARVRAKPVVSLRGGACRVNTILSSLPSSRPNVYVRRTPHPIPLPQGARVYAKPVVLLRGGACRVNTILSSLPSSRPNVYVRSTYFRKSAALTGFLSASATLKKSTALIFINLATNEDGKISTAFLSSLAAEL